MIMSMNESNKNNESVPNKDCNEEMTDVTSITDINSIRLIDKNKDNESVILNKEYNTKKIDVSLNIGESHMIMSMDESNKNNESVPNKDCNEEMTDVTSITDINSIRLIDKNKDNESVILNKEYNTKKIDVSLNISESYMIMSMDESNKNNESVSNKDCNEEMTNVTSNTGCHQKPTLLNGENEIYDKREEEITMIIDDSVYQEDIGTIIFTDENEKIIKKLSCQITFS
ncbi:suppressor of Mek1-like [Camponotus floridanus]|uniref:suppressor of Mek1-like n=1 Tax=Camponotus floridanus TaxID=104421 RepID=UPI000DC68293|nr:suppressor of Mek1-like [Camponotus floridanus]